MPASLPPAGVSDWLINQGALGVALILAILTIMRLWSKIEAKDAEIVRLNDLRISEAKAAGASLVKLAKASKGAIRRLGRAMGDEGDDDDDDDAGEDMGDKRTPPA